MSLPRSQRHLLVRGGTVVTLDAAGRVFTGDVLLTEGRIAALGPDLPPPPATRLLEAAGMFVLPGFVQAHVHLSHRLFRGLGARDRPIWRSPRMVALEKAHDDASAYGSVLLGAAECLLSGTTTVAEFGLSGATEGVFRGLEESGIRALAGPVIRGESGGGEPGITPAAQDFDRIETWMRARDGCARGRIRGSIQVDEADPSAGNLWAPAVRLARSLGVPMRTHVGGRLRSEDARKLLEQSGALDGFVTLAHGVHLDRSTRERLASRRVGWVWCPLSETRMGWGTPDPDVWWGSPGIHVASSTDGLGGEDGLDAWELLRFARAVRESCGAGVNARDLLESVTREGAGALGLADEVGSLEPGKAGDLIVLDLERPGGFASPDGSLYDRIVTGGGRHAIRWVVVDGEVLVDDDFLPHLDGEALRRRPAEATEELGRRLEKSNA